MNALTVDTINDRVRIMDGERPVALMLGTAKNAYKNGMALVRAFNARRVKWLKGEIKTTRTATASSRKEVGK